MTGAASTRGTSSAAVVEAVDTAVVVHRHTDGPLLEVLRSVQAELGYLPPETAALVADRLNLSRAEVHGVISFYTDFRDRPPARHTLRVCRAEACQAVGARALSAAAVSQLGTDFGEASPDGQWELETVFCLGNCALGPSVELDGRVIGRVDPDTLADRLAAAAGEGR